MTFVVVLSISARALRSLLLALKRSNHLQYSILARNLGLFGHRFLHLSPFQQTPIKPRSITHTSQAIKNFKKFTSGSEKV